MLSKNSSPFSQPFPQPFDNELSSVDMSMLKQINDLVGHNTMISIIQQFQAYSNQQRNILEMHSIQGDMNNLYHVAHQFKGESLQIGALKLGALCEQLELIIQEGQPTEVIAEILVKITREIERVNVVLTQVS